MVIWIVFTAVDSDVETAPHYIPHPVVGIRADSCGSFAGISRARLCFVVANVQRAPLGKLLNLNATRVNDHSHNAGVECSSPFLSIAESISYGDLCTRCELACPNKSMASPQGMGTGSQRAPFAKAPDGQTIISPWAAVHRVIALQCFCRGAAADSAASFSYCRPFRR
jgi:hypothetical protein